MWKRSNRQPNQLSILMIQLHPSTFVRRDEEMLSSFATVEVFQFRHQRGFSIFSELIRQKWFLLRNIWSSHIIYIWFADFHAVLPALFARLTGRKCVVVIGGVDAAYLPQYRYGTKSRLLGRLSLWLTVRMAHLLLPVSQFTLNDISRNVSSRLVRKSKVIHNCYSPAQIVSPALGNRHLVLSIAMASSESTLYIKGVDLFLNAAALMPDLNFMVVGLSGGAMNLAKRIAPPNVVLSEPISFEKLKELYAQTRVICQFSRQESFGIALLEGLAAGCVPVIANCCGPAEVFSGADVPAIDEFEPAVAAEAIKSAYRMEAARLKEIQQMVLPRFDCVLRSNRLQEILCQL